MVAAIVAFFESLTQSLKTFETHILEQSTTDVLTTKKRLKKASDITEEILEVVEKYKDNFSEKDLKKYNKLVHQFLKVN